MLDTISRHGEEMCVMTRNVRVVFWDFPRTKVFCNQSTELWGILWWKTHDMADLIELHQLCLQICSHAGLREFSTMCHRKDPASISYWTEKLGPCHRYLRWRT
jgi:hypothetical protein